MPSSSATPLQAVETAEQTLTAWISTPGATPIWPPMMSATCVPWPPSQSISPGDIGVDVLAAATDRVGIRREAPEGPDLADEVEAADDVRVLADQLPVGRCLVRRVAGVRTVGGVVIVDRGEVAEGHMGVVDAAVEDGDRHAGAIEARVGMDRRGANVRDGLLEVVGVVDDRRDRDDRRVGGQVSQPGGIHLEDDGVHGDLGSRDHGPGGRRDEPILLGLHLAQRASLAGSAGTVGSDLADRLLAEADDDLSNAPSGEQGRVQDRWPGHVDAETRIGDAPALEGLGQRSLAGEFGVGGEHGAAPEHGQQKDKNQR